MRFTRFQEGARKHDFARRRDGDLMKFIGEVIPVAELIHPKQD